MGPPRGVERRAHARLKFKGTAFPARCGAKELHIRLKDLSRGGASGLIEEPLAVGDYILIAFDESHNIEAQVRWTRRVMIGVEFTNLLSDAYVVQLYDTAPAMPVMAGHDWDLPAEASVRTVDRARRSS